jgi:glyoxylase-like metal-dependent hydrolase (beta-lactamase superfamily II)
MAPVQVEPGPATARWTVGEVAIARVVELETVGGSRFILPQATRGEIKRLDWLYPRFADADGRLKMSIHAYVLETPSRRIVVDTGLGNDKQGRAIPDWNGRSGTFLHDLAAAGYPPESIDTVLCTHLHVDHVGWNTRLVDGRWIPTFPRARYVMGLTEFDYWKTRRAPVPAAVFDDSIQPVADAGLVDLVESDHRLCDEVSLFPTAGHSPGHVSVHVRSQGEEALLAGDVAHHPCQMARLDWSSTVDFDPAQAVRTRRELFARFAGTPARILGGHFIGGRIVRDGGAFRLVE